VVARKGNYIEGDPTPTPQSFYILTPTPVPTTFWKQGAVFRVSPDGAVTKIAEGGVLNPQMTSYLPYAEGLDGIACDSEGTIYISHPGYAFPTPTPFGRAILKIANGSSTPELLASGDLLYNATGDLIVDSADALYITHQAYISPTPIPGVTVTPLPAEILKVRGGDGAISPYSAATLYSYTSPEGGFSVWSEPYDAVTFGDFDSMGNLILWGEFARQSEGAAQYGNILAIAPDGKATSLLDTTGLEQNSFCLGNNGAYVACSSSQAMIFSMNLPFSSASGSSIYIVSANSLDLEYIVHGDQAHRFSEIQYYPPEKPELSVNFDKEFFVTGENITLGCGLNKGRGNNDVDLYFGIQSPASAGGDIMLLNPNYASNGLQPLIPLKLALKFPAQISMLRYGNGTTTVKGNGKISLATFSKVSGISTGTYTLLGVMTQKDTNLLDAGKWLTPNKQPVTAKTFFGDKL